jgi:hypothetical protein
MQGPAGEVTASRIKAWKPTIQWNCTIFAGLIVQLEPRLPFREIKQCRPEYRRSKSCTRSTFCTAFNKKKTEQLLVDSLLDPDRFCIYTPKFSLVCWVTHPSNFPFISSVSSTLNNRLKMKLTFARLAAFASLASSMVAAAPSKMDKFTGAGVLYSEPHYDEFK